MNSKLQINIDYKIVNDLYICMYCNKEFKKFGLTSHILRKHLQMDIQYRSWNKGLSKETDNRVKQCGLTLSKNIELGLVIPPQTGIKHTKEHKDKLTKLVNNKIEKGEWHNSFSKSRTIEYKGIKFLGSWEVKFAQWLDKNNIKWERVKETFKYSYNNKIKQYTPDFYLTDSDTYIEIKGYPTEKDFAKWNDFPKTLSIISGPLLKDLGINIEYRQLTKVYKNISWI